MKYALLFIAYALYGQQAQQFSGDLAAEIQSAPAGWVGYSIQPSADGSSWQWCQSNQATVPPGPLNLYFQTANGKIDTIRLQPAACPLDSPFTLISNVPTDASLKVLQDIAASESSRRNVDQAVVAIAMHDSQRVEATLEALVNPALPEHTREKAAFWLGSRSSVNGVQVLAKLLENDASQRVREQAIFALSMSRQAEATDILIRTATANPAARLRSRSIFWLSQKGDARARLAVRNAIESDPDANVRKEAVFALSRFPENDAIPDLIDLALHGRPEIRKTAAFWIGQSKDPRALEFARQILSR